MLIFWALCIFTPNSELIEASGHGRGPHRPLILFSAEEGRREGENLKSGHCSDIRVDVTVHATGAGSN